MVLAVPKERPVPWLYRSCCPRFLVAGAVVAAVGLLAVGFEQFLNQARSLHLVQLPDSFAETILGEVLDVVLIEPVLVDDLRDQGALLVRARPRLALTVGATGRIAVLPVVSVMAIATILGMAIAVAVAV